MKLLKLPANAIFTNEVIIMIANFDIISVDKFYNLPEEEPYSLSFANCGYESTYFLSNMGFPIFIIYSHLILVPLYLILLYVSHYIPRIKWISNYLGTYLFWNGSIRLYIELY